MKILFFENIWGWCMTGLLGKDGAWFFGFSKRPAKPLILTPATCKASGCDACDGSCMHD